MSGNRVAAHTCAKNRASFAWLVTTATNDAEFRKRDRASHKTHAAPARASPANKKTPANSHIRILYMLACVCVCNATRAKRTDGQPATGGRRTQIYDDARSLASAVRAQHNLLQLADHICIFCPVHEDGDEDDHHDDSRRWRAANKNTKGITTPHTCAACG